MSLDTLGNLGDFIGGIGVVVTLGYLALQIRQNTEQVRQSLQVARAQTIRETMGQGQGWVFEVARDPGLADLYIKLSTQPTQLSDSERTRLVFLFGTILAECERNHLMHEEGLLTDERWEAQLRTLRFHVRQPGGKYYWERFAFNHTPSFARVVARELEGAPSAGQEPRRA